MNEVFEFTDDELHVLCSAVRTAIKQTEKNIRGLHRKFADEAVTTGQDWRLKHLNAVHEKIGYEDDV